MEPIGVFTRPNGEEVIVHRCRGCDFERFNRVAADDFFDGVEHLPRVAPRSAADAPAERGGQPEGAGSV